ncbi:MAG: DUF6178 family protein [Cystobacterineae bacterium]|nr:DUF6178 family protein [Cystobacterineae bacterium]MCL2258940.1 DUF6178 family protein [Cystobacterineae bacterium]
MTLAKRGSHGLTCPRSLLNSIIELPSFARTIQALPAQSFAALVRKVGIEDAGELVALATTEQLVQMFDEDLFVSDRAGERESLNVERFVVWLEVLFEAGDEVAANRIAELDEDFVAHALGGVLLVLEEDALRNRLDDGDEDEARMVDKLLESALTEDIDGYILIAKQHDGWDAVFALVLALDQNHRALLVRLLSRLARVGSACLDDLEKLSTVLSEGESLAEDAEAAREERRSKQGYVEARAARAFLSLARKPPADDSRPTESDPLTRAYFRDVERGRPRTNLHAAVQSLPAAALQELYKVDSSGVSSVLTDTIHQSTTVDVFTKALRNLGRDEPVLFGNRMEELAYLANVLVAGYDRDGTRLRPREATDAVIATVCYGALLELRASQPKVQRKIRPTASKFAEVLQRRSVDLLFRVASSALASGAVPGVPSAAKAGLLYSSEELETAIR